jgi:bacterioferritin-associated ferredoxin
MKKVILVLLIISTISYAKNLRLKDLPKELSNYYPPKSEKMEFVELMHILSTSLTGVVSNVKEDDWQNAQKWAERLQENYLRIGKMVKSWDKVLKKKDVKNIVEAVKSKNRSAVMSSVQAVGKSCVQCHKTYRLSAKIKFHAPDFSGTNIEDPVTGLDYTIEDYMKAMTNNMKMMRIHLIDGEKAKARKEGFDFIKRFEGMTQMCGDCHTGKLSEEVYFGVEAKKRITSLREAVVNGELIKINKNLKWISENNCAKCHNVHQTLYLLKEKFGK